MARPDNPNDPNYHCPVYYANGRCSNNIMSDDEYVDMYCPKCGHCDGISVVSDEDLSEYLEATKNSDNNSDESQQKSRDPVKDNEDLSPTLDPVKNDNKTKYWCLCCIPDILPEHEYYYGSLNPDIPDGKGTWYWNESSSYTSCTTRYKIGGIQCGLCGSHDKYYALLGKDNDIVTECNWLDEDDIYAALCWQCAHRFTYCPKREEYTYHPMSDEPRTVSNNATERKFAERATKLCELIRSGKADLYPH